MAFSANTIWEVRGATGSNSNGGGFVIGSGGTDYSQQAAAQATGTVTSSSTTVTATTGIFTAAMVGNYITDGTTWKQITAYTSSTVVTVDSAPSWTSVSIKVGGALATIGQATTNWVGGNRIYVKADGTYSISTPILLAVSFDPTTANGGPMRIIGYKTTRGDGTFYANRPTIQMTAGTSAINQTAICGCIVQYLLIDCNNVASSIGINMATMTNGGGVLGCQVKNFKSKGIFVSGTAMGATVANCEVTAGVSGATYAIDNQGGHTYGCWIHDNVCPGLNIGVNGYATWNQILNNTGDGIANARTPTLLNNLLYGNTGNGLLISDQFIEKMPIIKNNRFEKNGAYGIKCTGGSAAYPQSWITDGNTFWSNTSGATNNMNNVSGINAEANQYTNSADIIPSGDPSVNAAGANFMLNSTTGAGASVRASGWPGIFLGDGINIGYPDMGSFQHQDAGGGAGGGSVFGSSVIQGIYT